MCLYNNKCNYFWRIFELFHISQILNIFLCIQANSKLYFIANSIFTAWLSIPTSGTVSLIPDGRNMFWKTCHDFHIPTSNWIPSDIKLFACPNRFKWKFDCQPVSEIPTKNMNWKTISCLKMGNVYLEQGSLISF